jgi:hypothetical protein
MTMERAGIKFFLHVADDGRSAVMKQNDAASGFPKFTLFVDKDLPGRIKDALNKGNLNELALINFEQNRKPHVFVSWDQERQNPPASSAPVVQAQVSSAPVGAPAAAAPVLPDPKSLKPTVISGKISNNDFRMINTAMITDRSDLVINGQPFEGRALYSPRELNAIFGQIENPDTRSKAILGYTNIPSMTAEALSPILLRLTGNQPLTPDDIKIASLAGALVKIGSLTPRQFAQACEIGGGEVGLSGGLVCDFPKTNGSQSVTGR